MAKLSSINKNNKRIKLSNKLYEKRKKLKKIIMDKKLPLEERFKAQQKLSGLPKNSEVLVKGSVKNIKKMTISEKIKAVEEAKKTPEKKKK